MTDMKNLLEGIQEEIVRINELIPFYQELGAAGIFGLTALQSAVTEAEEAVVSGDVVRMLRAYKALQGCE